MGITQKRNRAFTLVELLVVIAIIGVMVGLLLPAVQAAREAARRSQCNNNLKQMGLALHNYHDTHNSFPPSCMKEKLQDDGGRAQTTTWHASLLPFMEQQPMFDQIVGLGFGIIWNDDGVNEELLRVKMPGYECPSSPDQIDRFDDNGATERHRGNYGVVVTGTVGYTISTRVTNGENNNHMDDGGYGHSRWNGPFLMQNRTTRFADIIDGTSNTLFIGERYRNLIGQRTYIYIGTPNGQNQHSKWAGSTGIQINTLDTGHAGYAGFHSAHPGGAQFLRGDGSSTFISENIDRFIYASLGTRNGKESVAMP